MKTAPGQSSIILPQCWNASFCNTGYLTDDASVRPHLCPHLFRWFSVAFGLRFRSHGRPLDCAHASNIFESWFNSARGALRCLVPSNPDLPLYCLERTCELENWRSSESSMLHKLVRFPCFPTCVFYPGCWAPCRFSTWAEMPWKNFLPVSSMSSNHTYGTQEEENSETWESSTWATTNWASWLAIVQATLNVNGVEWFPLSTQDARILWWFRFLRAILLSMHFWRNIWGVEIHMSPHKCHF